MTRRFLVMPNETGWNILYEGTSVWLPKAEGWTEEQLPRLEALLDKVVGAALDYRSYCA